MDYKARMYDPALKRFLQPDSIIPRGTSQSLNRYSYVGNSPIGFNDPTGHMQENDDDGGIPLDSEGAGDWANDHDGKDDPKDEPYSPPCQTSNCTDFTSTSYYQGGNMPATPDWNPGLGCGANAWSNANYQFVYFHTHGFEVRILPIMPKGAPASSVMTPVQIQQWFLDNKIPKGSLVYYYTGVDPTGIVAPPAGMPTLPDGKEVRFSHVGISTGNNVTFRGVSVPAVTDFDGDIPGPNAIFETGTYITNTDVGTEAAGINPYYIYILIPPHP